MVCWLHCFDACGEEKHLGEKHVVRASCSSHGSQEGKREREGGEEWRRDKGLGSPSCLLRIFPSDLTPYQGHGPLGTLIQSIALHNARSASRVSDLVAVSYVHAGTSEGGSL
jgi:hypothetical protein